jgi:hypothetical protein
MTLGKGEFHADLMAASSAWRFSSRDSLSPWLCWMNWTCFTSI